jgi:acyl-CoA thioester hydrolase
MDEDGPSSKHHEHNEDMLEPNILTNRTQTTVRFSEIDSLGIVWHGNYIQYFEDGREAFGREFGLSYMDVFQAGFVTPIVQLHINYKRSLSYGESVIIETTYQDDLAARIIFNYRILRSSDYVVLATGSTVQSFLDLERALVLTIPLFFLEWKKRHGILSS